MTGRLEETVIFLHLPKTAGTTIRSMLQPNFDPEAVYTIDAHHQRDSFDAFADWPNEEKRKIRLVQGHMNFGFHRLLPGPSSYVTMLRHPVDRIISHYYEMVRRGPPHPLHNAIVQDKLSVAEYACSRLSNEFNNHQLRMLINAEGIAYGEMTGEHLQAAKDILEAHFAVTGVQDCFDEFAIQLKKRFRLKSVDYAKRNVTWKRPGMDALSKTDYESILAENVLDMELYEHVKNRVLKQSRALVFQAKLYYFRKRQSIKARRNQAVKRRRAA